MWPMKLIIPADAPMTSDFTAWIAANEAATQAAKDQHNCYRVASSQEPHEVFILHWKSTG